VRSARLLAAWLLLASLPVRAGDAVDIQQFKPAPGSEDAFGVQSARPGRPAAWHSFAAIHYANRPFRLVDQTTGRTAATIVGHQTAADVGGSWVWKERWELGAVLPVTLNQTSGSANDLDPRAPRTVPAQGVGDLRLVPKGRLFLRDTWTLGASAPISLPTGGDGFLGRTGPTLRPRVLASWGAHGDGRMEVMGMGGLVVRSSEKLLNFDQGLSLEYGAAAVRPFTIRGWRLAGIASLGGEMGLPDRGEEERPLELLGGLRWLAASGTAVTIGAGPGLTRGAGTPDYRLLVMVTQGSARPTRAIPPPDDSIKVDRETLKLAITEPVHFGTDNDLIEPRSYQILQDVARFLLENPWVRKMRIEGHTDGQGGEQYNLNLSQLRAISIARFLVKNGVDPDTLDSKGFGLTRPVDTNETEEGRAKNRRVEFVILDIEDEIAPSWAKAAFAPAPAPAPTTPPAPTPAP